MLPGGHLMNSIYKVAGISIDIELRDKNVRIAREAHLEAAIGLLKTHVS